MTSSASSSVSDGRMDGSRRASIVFPAPGGPTSRHACPPAAAISSARLALACPDTSAKSTFSSHTTLSIARSARDNDPACNDSTSEPNESAVNVHSDRTSDASATFGGGMTNPRSGAALARCRATDSTPRTGRIAPSSPSSPRNARPSTRLGGQRTEGDEEPDRDRQVEAGPRLSLVARRKTHGHAPSGDREAGIGECGRDALAALLHLAGWKTDDRPVRQPLGDVDLDANVVGVDSEHGGRADGGEHVATLAKPPGGRVIISLPNRS